MSLERSKQLYSGKCSRELYFSVFLVSCFMGYFFPGLLSVVQVVIAGLSIIPLTLSFLMVSSPVLINVRKVVLGFILCQIALFLNSSQTGPAFLVGLAGSAFLFIGVISSVKRALRVDDHEVNLTIGAFSGLVLLLFSSGFYFEKLTLTSSHLFAVFSVRDFLVFSSIGIVLMFLIFHPRYTSSSSLNLGFFSTSNFLKVFSQLKSSRFLFPIIFFSFFGTVQNVFSLVTKDTFGLQVDLSLLFLPAITHLFFLLVEFRIQVRQNEQNSRILAEGGRKFLMKASSDGKAHTFAVQTYIYTFDHDPAGALNSASPATLMQIRTEEVRKLLSGISMGKVVDEASSGSRMYGALDPEHAICLTQEALLISVISYLNISSIVNRRMQGLISILPIIDPMLSRATHVQRIEDAQTSSSWLFYLDFDWVDQHLVPTRNGANFCSNYSILPEWLKTSILNVKGSGVPIGSMLWLSEKAGMRVIQEMPHLKPIVQIFPISVMNSNTEVLLYAIRFTELAPRLQGLYDMDSRRRLLLDFEPSEECLRLVGSLRRRLPHIHGSEEVRHMINTISSYDWRGFKEKDLAIHLLTEVWQSLSRSLTPNSSQSQEVDRSKINGLSDSIVQSILEIGYPSQHLHVAQIQKNSLRNMATLRESALDAGHIRFTEAWTLLSTGVVAGSMEVGSREVYEIVQVSLTRPEILKSKIFQFRVVDVICFVLSKMDWITDKELSLLFSQVIHQLGSDQMEPDLLVTWFDRLQWVHQCQLRSIILQETDITFLLNIIDALEGRHQRNLAFLKTRVADFLSKGHSDLQVG